MKWCTIVIAVVLATIMNTNFGWADWTRDTVGLYTRYYEVKVADGRNDGVQRVYCCCYNGHVVAWSFDGNDWTMVDCGAAPPAPDNRLISMWIGDGRGDGLNRVYSACANGHVYEFSYSGGSWVMSDLGTPRVFYAGQSTLLYGRSTRRQITSLVSLFRHVVRCSETLLSSRRAVPIMFHLRSVMMETSTLLCGHRIRYGVNS